MKNFIIRLYKRLKSEMPLFFKRLGALSTALTAMLIFAFDHKEKLPPLFVSALSEALAVSISVTIFCLLTKVKDLPGADDDDKKNEDKAA